MRSFKLITMALTLGCTSVSACRLDNPAFHLDAIHLQNSQAKADSSAPQALSIQSQTTTEATNNGPQATEVTSAPVSSSRPTTTIPSSSTSGTPNSQSSSGWTPPKSFVYASFCERGAKYCYPVTETAEQPAAILDQGPHKNHLTLDPDRSKSGVTNGSTQNLEPFARAYYLRSGGTLTAAQPYEYQGAELGFDLWFDPDVASGDHYALFEIDGVLGLRRSDDGNFHCVSKNGTKTIVAAAKVPNEQKFNHISCALRDGVVRIQINGNITQRASELAKAASAPADLLFGRAGTLTLGAGAFVGRVAMLRVWDNVHTMDWSTSREVTYACNDPKHTC